MVWPNGERLKRWRERRAEAKAEREAPEEEIEVVEIEEPKKSTYEKMKEVAEKKGAEEQWERERKETADIEKRKLELEKLKKQEQQWKEIAEIRSYREKIARHREAARPRGRYGGGRGGLFSGLGKIGEIGYGMFGVSPTGADKKKGAAPPPRRPRLDFFGGMAAPKQPIVGGISAPKQPVVGIGGVSKAPAHPIISLWGPPKKKKSGG